jgi:hypothetical protein
MITAICCSEKPQTPAAAYGSVTSETDLVVAGQTQAPRGLDKITAHPKDGHRRVAGQACRYSVRTIPCVR